MSRSKLSLGLLALCAVSLALSVQEPVKELKGEGRPDAPGLEDFACYDTGYGFLFTKNRDNAAKMVAEVKRGAKLFRQYLKKEPTQGVVIEVPDGTSMAPPIVDAGIRWTYLSPTLGPELFKKLEDDYREQLKTGKTPMTEKAIDDAVKQYSASLRRNMGEHGLRILTHELGHQWFHTAFWDDFPPTSYGSPADDYLDECVAIMLEPDFETKTRWKTLKDVYAKPEHRRSLRPLKTLVTMEHPSRTPDSSKAGDVYSDVWFYSQCRALIDFLREKTKDEAIFAGIAEAAVKEQGFLKWLKDNGEKHGLPTDIDKLHAQWQQWIEARLKTID